jgi:transcription elongation GreA/GreB family factor
MSRAFTRQDDTENVLADIGERPISHHRNLVTEAGLAMMDKEVARLRADLAQAEAEGNRERIALVSRDLRYWNARRETAELSVPDPGSTVVRFGMAVTIEREDGKRQAWTIVGEDEADAAHGSISHVAPVARALFGKSVGDVATINGKGWEIIELGAAGRHAEPL